jgi:8-oxo-dGTP diphosphatase
MILKSEQKPEAGVGVCVVKDGKVLLGKRLNSHGNGCWSFPGGHLEMYETWEQCAEREVLEETGIRIKNIRFAGVTNDLFIEERKHYITLFMMADFETGELKIMEPEKCSEWNWFSWDRLPQPLFLPITNLRKQGFTPFPSLPEK